MRTCRAAAGFCSEAFIDAFDFEWTNKNIMYGSYQRTHSVFQNSNMMAIGKPSADELALLESFRGKVPDEVFGEPFVPPVSDGSGQDRSLLRKASPLLQKAGFVIKDGIGRVVETHRAFGCLRFKIRSSSADLQGHRSFPSMAPASGRKWASDLDQSNE